MTVEWILTGWTDHTEKWPFYWNTGGKKPGPFFGGGGGGGGGSLEKKTGWHKCSKTVKSLSGASVLFTYVSLIGALLQMSLCFFFLRSFCHVAPKSHGTSSRFWGGTCIPDIEELGASVFIFKRKKRTRRKHKTLCVCGGVCVMWCECVCVCVFMPRACL